MEGCTPLPYIALPPAPGLYHSPPAAHGTVDHAGLLTLVGCDGSLGSDPQSVIGEAQRATLRHRLCEVCRQLCASASRMLGVKLTKDGIASGPTCLKTSSEEHREEGCCTDCPSLMLSRINDEKSSY